MCSFAGHGLHARRMDGVLAATERVGKSRHVWMCQRVRPYNLASVVDRSGGLACLPVPGGAAGNASMRAGSRALPPHVVYPTRYRRVQYACLMDAEASTPTALRTERKRWNSSCCCAMMCNRWGPCSKSVHAPFPPSVLIAAPGSRRCTRYTFPILRRRIVHSIRLASDCGRRE